MSRTNNLRGTYVSILMGDGATPEVFTVLCGITTRSLVANVNTSDAFNRDCALPDDIPVRELITTGKSWEIRGSGQMNRDNMKLLDAAVGVTKNFRFFIARKTSELPGGTAVNGYWGGPAKITSRTINGNDADYTGVDMTIASDGAWTWTDVAT